MSRSEEELPTSRRAMPQRTPQLGLHGPKRRTIDDMTVAEAVCFVIVLILGCLGLAAFLANPGIGFDPSDAFAWSVFAAPPLGLLAYWWVSHHAPWYGPFRSGPRPPRRPGRFSRFGHWWCAPGRWGLAVALIGAFLATTSFYNAVDDRNLVDDLRDHGERVPAVVTDIDYLPRTGRDNVTVRFESGTGTRSEDLMVLDTVPGGLGEGDRIEVVFDPKHPDRVLMPQQLRYGHARLNKTMGWVFVGVFALGILWWLRRASARRALTA